MAHICNHDSWYPEAIYSTPNNVFFPLILSDSGSALCTSSFTQSTSWLKSATCIGTVTIRKHSPRVSEATASQERGLTYLHRPEVKGQKEKHSDETAHKASAEPVTAHIGDDGTHSEKQVEKGGQGMPRRQPRRPSHSRGQTGSQWAHSVLSDFPCSL